jgi:hypothetical protein
MTTPLTGPAAPGYKDIAPAAEAYFDYVNANGGINGRKIDLKVYDDAYNPAKTKVGTNQLINRDKIFAMYGALGTPTHSAVVRTSTVAASRTSSSTPVEPHSTIPRRYPMTFPYFPSYIVEAKAMGYYIDNTSSLKNKRACLMYQDGEFGDNAKTGFNAAGIDFARRRATTPVSSWRDSLPRSQRSPGPVRTRRLLRRHLRYRGPARYGRAGWLRSRRGWSPRSAPIPTSSGHWPARRVC